jgi:hypothetical protein
MHGATVKKKQNKIFALARISFTITKSMDLHYVYFASTLKMRALEGKAGNRICVSANGETIHRW